MSSATTVDWRQFTSQAQFQKWVDGLSGDAFKALINSDEQFRNRIENKPWDSTPNVRDAAPARAAKEEADKQFKATIKEWETQVQALAIEMRDKLKRRLDSGTGLTSDLVKFFLDAPEYKNLPMYSTAGSGGSFTPADKAQMKRAYEAFCVIVDRKFTSAEQSILFDTMVDAGGLGKALSPMDTKCWRAAFLLAKTVGRISHKAAPQPVEESMADRVSKIAEPPTAADKRRAYMQNVVYHSRALGRDLTMNEIDRLNGDDYASIIREGFSTDGVILRSTDQLRRGAR